MTVIYGLLRFTLYTGAKSKGRTLYVTVGDNIVTEQVISTNKYIRVLKKESTFNSSTGKVLF